MPRKKFYLACATAILLAIVITACVGVAAQENQQYKNLKVLPKDITKPELLGTMRSFASALGVGCDHCHARSQDPHQPGLDFASDKKDTKKAARMMLRMVSTINGELATKLDSTESTGMKVSCMTCHHRQERPRSLKDEMVAAVDSGGVDAAVALYKERREKFYGTAAYDFGQESLLDVADALAESGKTEPAVAIVQLNMQQFPDLVWNYEELGSIYSDAGDVEKAKAALKKGLELDPENRRLQHMLQELTEGKN